MRGIMEHARGGVNKLETGVQILELFQGVDLVLLTQTWHFLGQHLPHVEGFASFAVAHTVQLGKTKVIKHSRGLLLTFIATLTQTCHNGRKEATILIHGYGSVRVLPLTCLFTRCTLPLLAPNTRANPCSKTWQQILLKFKL
jgi:hypothetical protein